MKFITVDAEFRRQWGDNEGLDKYLEAINRAVYDFKLAFYAKNGNIAQFDDIFSSKQIFMLPRSLYGITEQVPILDPKATG